jgi:hypothetical protein
MRAEIEPLVSRLLTACQDTYGGGLVSVVLFGSVARGTAGPESDLDVLIVANGLPDGRVVERPAVPGGGAAPGGRHPRGAPGGTRGQADLARKRLVLGSETGLPAGRGLRDMTNTSLAQSTGAGSSPMSWRRCRG